MATVGTTVADTDVERAAKDATEIMELMDEGGPFDDARALIARVDNFLDTYKTLEPSAAFASANQLIDETSQLAKNPTLSNSSWADQLDSLRWRLFSARDDVKAAAEGAQIESYLGGICPPLLAAASVPPGLASLPLAYTSDRPNMTLGDYLCLFTRLQTLGGVQQANDATISVNVSDVVLHFSQEKQIAGDDYYAPPASSTPGRVAYALVQIDANGRSTRITNFNDNALALDLFESKFGANPVP